MPYVHVTDADFTIKDIYGQLWKELHTTLFETIQNKWKQYPEMVLQECMEETWIRGGGCNGEYTVRLGLRFLVDPPSNDISSWVWIWNLKVPEKICPL